MNAPFGLRHCCCRRFIAAFTRHVFFSGENKIFKVSVWFSYMRLVSKSVLSRFYVVQDFVFEVSGCIKQVLETALGVTK
jgi:hypothetical protein